MDIELISTVALINTLGVISPGPASILVVKNSLQHSRTHGLATALGIALGDLVHIFYCSIGVAVIIAHSLLLFSWLKFLGGLYLIYLGISTLMNKKKSNEDNVPTESTSPLVSMKQGLFLTMLNPKATLMFLSLFTLVITPNTSLTTYSILVVMMFLTPLVWFSTVTCILSNIRVRALYTSCTKYINGAFGSLLTFFGLALLLSTNENNSH